MKKWISLAELTFLFNTGYGQYKAYKKLSVTLGTTGLGGEFSQALNERFDLAGEISYLTAPFKFNATLAFQSVTVEPMLSTFQAGVRLDLYPFTRYVGSRDTRIPIKLSAGVYVRSSGDYKGRATMKGQYYIGQFALEPEDLGYVDVIIKTNSFLPYAGAGFDFKIARQWGMGMDMGIFYHGKPEVEMTGTGVLNSNEENADQLESNLQTYTWFPNLRIKLNYRIH